MKMLSATRLKIDFLAYFRLLAKTDHYLDVAYKGRLYRLHVEDLNINVPKKPRHKKKPTLDIIQSRCSLCGSISFNGECTAPIKHV